MFKEIQMKKTLAIFFGLLVSICLISDSGNSVADEKVVHPDIIVFTQPSRCPPCRRLEPIIINLEKKYNVVKILVDSEPGITRQHKVDAIPTILILKNGVEIHRFIGFTEQSILEKNIKER